MNNLTPMYTYSDDYCISTNEVNLLKKMNLGTTYNVATNAFNKYC